MHLDWRQAERPFRLPAIRLGGLAALVLLSYGGFRAAGMEPGFPPLQPFTLALLTVFSGWAMRRELLLGLAAGWIVHRRGRLMPMVIAHWVINLLFGVIPQIVVGIILLSG